MASSFDSLLRLELQAVGENANTWGDKTNNNLELLADAIAGATSISIAGSGNYTLTTANASTDQARKAFITLTGTLTGNRNIIVPSSSKIYFVRNNTSGAFTVTFKTASGVGALVPQGYVLAIACDGTDCFDASEVARVAKSGDTMTGTLSLPAGTSVSASQALRADEIDARISVARAGVSALIASVSAQTSVNSVAIAAVSAAVSTLTITVANVSAQVSGNAVAVANLSAVVSSNKVAAPLLASANTFTGYNTFTSTVAAQSDFLFNSGYGSAAIAYGCRAWVNFNGLGTVSIRSSGNVSSITDNNVGDYTINFTNSMPDANYATIALGYTSIGDSSTLRGIQLRGAPTINTARIFAQNGINAFAYDGEYISVAIFR